MSVETIEARIRNRIELLTDANAGLPPPRIYVTRGEREALLAAGYAPDRSVTDKIWIDGVEVIAMGRAASNG